MSRAVVALAVALTSMALFTGASMPGFAQGNPDLVRQALDAAGGEAALRALKTLRMNGAARFWEPDQSFVAGGPALFVGDSKLTTTWDFASGDTRIDWDRGFVARANVRYSEIATPKFGFVTDDKGSRAMSGIRIATQLRELQRVSPMLLAHMLDAGGNVAFEGGLKLNNVVLPAMTFRDGATTFHVLFNKVTKLPAAVRTFDEDGVRGTAVFDAVFDGWKPVGGVMVAHTLTYMVADTAVARINYNDAAANAPIDPQAFAASAEVMASAKPPTTGGVPYQWVIRRLAFGRFLDSDDVFVPPGGSLKLTELASNVAHVTGGTHNGLVVAMKEGVVVFDAPTGGAQSHATLDAIKAKYDRPVKTLVLTHHHSDHSAGMRVYVAEHAAVLVPAPDRKYFALMALAQRPVADDLEKKHISADITEINDRMELKDDATEIRLYRVANQHADGMLIAHIMPANIVWESDLWTPGQDTAKSPGAIALNDALKKFGISGATIAGGHGATAPQAELEKIFAAK